MSKETVTALVTWSDERARHAKTKFQFATTMTSAQVEAVLVAGEDIIKAVTEAGMSGIGMVFPAAITATSGGTTTGTNTAMDKLNWRFKDADGNYASFQTPCPMVGKMNDDDYHVKDTDADIIAFINWVIANLQTPYGKAITTFVDCVRGYRNRKSKNK